MRAGEGVLRRLGAVSLAAWCATGLIATGAALAGPLGWRIERSPGTAGVVGAPLPGADLVTAARELLARTTGQDRRWLFVLPPDVPELVAVYTRQQLAHTEWPRVVDVATPPASVGDAYGGLVVPAGVAPASGWRRAAEHAGLVAWERLP